MHTAVLPVVGRTLMPVAALALCVLALLAGPAAWAQKAQAVNFTSGDGKTELVAYMYLPSTPGPHPAVVMLHGRGGLYSTLKQTFDGDSLSSRHVMWGKFWAERGYVGLLVDSFGPRGYARGFEAGTNDGSRPASVNEITIRPLDAYAALKFLRNRPDVIKDQVFLQGWSNGGSTALSAASIVAPGIEAPTETTGFRAFLSMYPACAQVMRRYTQTYRSYAPMLVLIGTDDEEVNPERCARLSEIAERNGSDWQFVLYPGVEHSYDTPTKKRESVEANKLAAEDSKQRAQAFFGKFLAR
ncbi:carboxymethylenebutenolidase [Polaromonas sp. YR568]|uniref:dienelactone hydrolase family protein n=1 Tax=Polaromonas sp. YR568 TaxID=1855301 RepID=UPI0008E9FB73|nr:dienelactone hydrolase family protein [Polaromonas sp. YR568]SFU80460.1 carboxymethylenebutenolidase [Polaromonas sp. YR568]